MLCSAARGGYPLSGERTAKQYHGISLPHGDVPDIDGKHVHTHAARRGTLSPAYEDGRGTLSVHPVEIAAEHDRYHCVTG